MIVSDVREVDNKFNPNKKRLVIDLQDKDNSVRSCNLNLASQKNLIKAFGKETTEWLNQTVYVHKFKQLVSGEMKNVLVLDNS